MGFLELFGIKWQAFENATRFLLDNQSIALQIKTGDSGYFNYFTTCFAYFYFDMKYFGVIIHSLLFGYFAHGSYDSYRNKPNVKTAGIYMVWLIVIALSMMDYAFAEVSIGFGFMYFIVNCRNGKKGLEVPVADRHVLNN